MQFPCSRRLRDNRQQLPGNVQKTLKSLETNKKNKKQNKKSEEKRKRKKAQKLNEERERERERVQKHKQNANTTEKRKKKEIHSNPIYTNLIKNFPSRSDDLVRFSIAKLKMNCPQTLQIKQLTFLASHSIFSFKNQRFLLGFGCRVAVQEGAENGFLVMHLGWLAFAALQLEANSQGAIQNDNLRFVAVLRCSAVLRLWLMHLSKSIIKACTVHEQSR